MDANNLVYTVAIDPPNSSGNRTLAKMLASSLLRTYFTGDIIVFRNTTAPLFPVERKGLEEIYIDTGSHQNPEARAEDAWCWKYRVRDQIDPSAYDKVMFLDADSLALRNIDHLLDGDWDIAYQPERALKISLPQFSCFLTDTDIETHGSMPGVNSGTIAVRADRYHEIFAEWKRIDTGPTARPRTCSDQGSWNKLLLETEHHKVPFERGEVAFPMYLDPKYSDYKLSALTHNLGGDLVDKIRFTFGLYASTFYCDPSALVLDLLEM